VDKMKGRKIIEQDGKYYIVYNIDGQEWVLEINEDEAKFLQR
jgi:hypothetical protein